MAKGTKTNIGARHEQKLAGGTCRACGNKAEIVIRVSSAGKRHTARLCCEKAGIRA